MAGLERIELPPSVSKTEMISISPKTEYGTTGGIRTPIGHFRRVLPCPVRPLWYYPLYEGGINFYLFKHR